MSTCAKLGCSNNQTKNKDKSFCSLPSTPEIKKAWLNGINRKKDNLPHKVVACSNHFEEQCFDCSWRLQNELYHSDRPVKRKLIKGAIPTILPYQNISNNILFEISQSYPILLSRRFQILYRASPCANI